MSPMAKWTFNAITKVLGGGGRKVSMSKITTNEDAHLKGLSHVMDFKNFDKNLQNLAYQGTRLVFEFFKGFQ